MKINLYLLGIISIIVLIILPILIFEATNRNQLLRKKLMFIFSVFYFVLLIAGTICKIDNDYPYLIFSFDFTQPWFKIKFMLFNFGISNILINLGMFIPLGYIVVTFSPKKYFFKTIILSFLFSIIIELYQWILPITRDSEIGDIILNCLSGVMSACWCKILEKLNVKFIS